MEQSQLELLVEENDELKKLRLHLAKVMEFDIEKSNVLIDISIDNNGFVCVNELIKDIFNKSIFMQNYVLVVKARIQQLEINLQRA